MLLLLAMSLLLLPPRAQAAASRGDRLLHNDGGLQGLQTPATLLASLPARVMAPQMLLELPRLLMLP